MDELLTKFFGCFAFHVQNGNKYQNGYLVVIVLTVVPRNFIHLIITSIRQFVNII